MSRYKAYPEYKDSGVQWLGTIPTGWSATSIKRKAAIFNGATPKSDVSSFWDGDIPWITPADLGKEKTPYIGIGARSISIDGYKSCGTSIVPKNSIILASRAPIGTVGIATQALCTNQGCKSLVVSEGLESKFLFYVLLSSTAQLNLLGRGTTFLELSADELGSYKVGLPSSIEQTAITSFLDHETAKIDALIEKQQRLIELLKEKRQAVISHAVTKGIDPNAPMKDSGVEWLGEVPVHWSLKKISHIGRVLNGSTPDKSKFSFWNEGSIPWLASSCLNSPTVDEPTELISAQAFERSSLELIPAGSLLVGMVGQGKTRGTSAVLTIESCINQNMAAIIPSKHVNINFLYYLFQAMYHDLRELGRGGNQAALNCEIVASIRVPIPAIEEQQCIVSFISKQLAVMILATDSADQQIKLLHERRSALISAAVTGKIDVRDWQAAA